MVNKWQRWKGIMKCVPFEEKRLNKWQPPYIVQPKYDGDRSRGIPLQYGNYLLLSSEENILYSVPHLNESLNNSPLADIELDFELYDHNLFLEGGHELIYSIVSRTVNLHPRYKEMKLYALDIKSNEPQISRMTKLLEIGELNIPNVVVSPYWICNTLGEIKECYDRLIKLKYEGIIVRHLYNIYEEKRSTFVMKFKPKKTDSYKIVGWKEEVSINGIPKSRIGSIAMSSQSGDEFSVSAGLDDSEKEYLWEIKGLLAGCTAIVHYQHLTNRKIPKGTFDIEIPELGINRDGS